MDGDERKVFGRIRDVVVGSDRTVYLLDDQSSAVSAFTLDGAYLGSVGGAGGGPGEFRAPVGLTTGLALGRRGDGLLVATLHEGSLANPAGALEWRVLDPARGVEVERSTAAETFVSMLDEALVTYVNEPFPQVFIRRPDG